MTLKLVDHFHSLAKLEHILMRLALVIHGPDGAEVFKTYEIDVSGLWYQMSGGCNKF